MTPVNRREGNIGSGVNEKKFVGWDQLAYNTFQRRILVDVSWNEDSVLQEHAAASAGNQIPPFLGKELSMKIFPPLKMTKVCCLERLGFVDLLSRVRS